MDNLEDAVALFSPRGELMFSNSAMRARCLLSLTTAASRSRAAAGQPVRQLVERALAGRRSQGPVSSLRRRRRRGGGSRRAAAHVSRDRGHGRAIPGRDARRAQSRLPEPRALHAQLLAQAGGARPVDGRRCPRGEEPAQRDDHPPRATEAEARGGAASRSPSRPAPADGATSISTKHVTIIADEIQRLDQVVVGFLKFARPDELKLQPVQLPTVMSEVSSMDDARGGAARVTMKTECPPTCRTSTPTPGCCSRRCSTSRSTPARRCLTAARCGSLPRRARRRVDIDVEDTGVGIPPENLGQISTCISRPRKRAAASGCRWCTASSSCTTARSRCSRRLVAARVSGLMFPQA